MQSATRYLLLNRKCALKRLENLSIYNRATDELYEVSDKAFAFLERCLTGLAERDLQPEEVEFAEEALSQGILEWQDAFRPRSPQAGAAPRPSLRYLELQLTDACNLRCRHCYVGDSRGQELPLKRVEQLLAELEEMQGLAVLLSGGEPLLYRDFWRLNERLGTYDLRTVLLTNGTLIGQETARQLQVDAVQVSLDGLEEAHDFLRGTGAFRRACAAIAALKEAGKSVSIATMVYRYNMGDFADLEKMLDTWGIEEWNIDVPSPGGRLSAYSDLLPDMEAAAAIINRFSRGGGHYTAEGSAWSCGAHLATVTASGLLAKCGFYASRGIPLDRGLLAAWELLPRTTLDQLQCACSYLEECRGGCRYRAEVFSTPLGPDPVQCYRYGIELPGRRWVGCS